MEAAPANTRKEQ